MKQTNFLKSFFLLCALIVGSSNVWADNTFVQVTDASGLQNGDEILVVSTFANKSIAMLATVNSGNSKYMTVSEVTISNSNTITLADNSPITVWTLVKDGNDYSFKSGNNYVYSNSAEKNTANTKTTVDNSVKHTIEGVSNGLFQFKNKQNTSKFLKGGNNGDRFAYYASTADNTAWIKIFKKTVPVTGVSLNLTSKTLYEGENFDLTSTITPSNATNKSINWSVVSESESGVVTLSSTTAATTTITAQKVGTAKVRVTTIDGSQTADCDITVVPATLGNPVFSIDGGAVYYGTKVFVTADNSTLITYTIDGNDPNEGSDEFPAAGYTITGAVTIKVIAFNDDDDSSDIVAKSFTVKAPDAPTITPSSGNVTSGTNATITAADGVDIIYTTDGSIPSFDPFNGNEYTGVIHITDGMTLKAIAVDGAGNESTVAEATYTFPSEESADATYVFNTDEGLSALGITKPSTGSGTDLVSSAKYTSGDLTMEISHGSTNTRVWNASGDTDLRVYASGKVKLSVPTGYTITAIVMDRSQGTFTSNVGTWTNSTGKWTGSASAIEFTASDQNRILSIDVTYTAPAVKNTVTSALYSTFYNSKAVVVPENTEAYTVKVSDEKLVRSHTYNAGDIIAGGTGVVVKASASIYMFRETIQEGTEDANNLLSGSDVAATTIGPDGCKFYKLSLNASDTEGTVGFYWGAENGGAFTNGAHKAYLIIPSGVTLSSKNVILFSDIESDSEELSNETTGIKSIENGEWRIENPNSYNLAGQRVGKDYKGIVIVNGKKKLNK